MAHTIKKRVRGERPGSALQGSLVTKEMVMNAIEAKGSSEEFYELEPVEVLDVWVDEEYEDFPVDTDGEPDFSLTGGILGRFVYSQQGAPKEQCINFKPLNPNINMMPVRGEIVIGVKYLNDYFYTTILNCFGSPNQNIRKNLSTYRKQDDGLPT